MFALAGVAILCGLGMWQLERKAWKENLIATLSSRLAAAPGDLPPRDSWRSLKESEAEFRRVTFPAEFLAGEEALVYTAGSPLRPDVKGPGYWVFTPAQLAGGSIVLVNRGFIPVDRKDPATRSEGTPHGSVDIVGVIRWPETRNSFTPPDDQGQCLVPARFQCDCRIEEMVDRGTVLYRSGVACSADRYAEAGQARSSFAGQSS